jgi:rhodanese-related sulfurtransferase
MDNKTFYIYTGIAGLFYSIYAGSRFYSLSGIHLISSEKAKEYIKKGTITNIIDVRTEMEWKMGHHPLASHIPIGSISKKSLQNNNTFFNEGILVYCNSGQRARFASELIAKLGYKKIYYIDGTYNSIM